MLFMPSIFLSSASFAVKSMIGMCEVLKSFFKILVMAIPSFPGSPISQMMRSGMFSKVNWMAVFPLSAVRILFSDDNFSAIKFLKSSLSSTISNVCAFKMPSFECSTASSISASGLMS